MTCTRNMHLCINPAAMQLHSIRSPTIMTHLAIESASSCESLLGSYGCKLSDTDRVVWEPVRRWFMQEIGAGSYELAAVAKLLCAAGDGCPPGLRAVLETHIAAAARHQKAKGVHWPAGRRRPQPPAVPLPPLLPKAGKGGRATAAAKLAAKVGGALLAQHAPAPPGGSAQSHQLKPGSHCLAMPGSASHMLAMAGGSVDSFVAQNPRVAAALPPSVCAAEARTARLLARHAAVAARTKGHQSTSRW